MSSQPANKPDRRHYPTPDWQSPDRRLRLYNHDCLSVLRRLRRNSVSAIVTDPPYGLSREPNVEEVLRQWLDGKEYAGRSRGFTGEAWDQFVPGPSIWKECLRVLKPGVILPKIWARR